MKYLDNTRDASVLVFNPRAFAMKSLEPCFGDKRCRKGCDEDGTSLRNMSSCYDACALCFPAERDADAIRQQLER